MSTLEDFENAPVGSTATRPGVPLAVKVSDRQRIQGNWDDGFVKMSVETLVDYDYALNPPAPTTAREALDMAWNLAHEVKKGQTIPKGAKYLERHNGALREYTAFHDMNPKAGGEEWLRTLDPLPEPEPDWLDAPAVLAAMNECSWQKVWLPSTPGHWECTCCGVDRHWSDMADVTPLYPKGQEA